MKTQVVFVIIGIIAIILILVYFSALIAWLPPLLIGLFILIRSGKDDISKYIGFLSLKPAFTILLWFFIGNLDLYKELSIGYSYTVIRATSWGILELIITLAIAYSFRHLFNKDRIALLFLIGDIIRWLSVFISLWLPDPIPEPYFYTQLYVGVFFILIFPSLYAIYGLMAIRKRANSQNAAY